MESQDQVYLPISESCFVCGKDNPAGLGVRFYRDGDTVKTRWRPAEHHCGYQNVVHGGVIAAALDECMAWAATWQTRLMCVTGDLHIRYLRRLPSDRELFVCGWVTVPGKKLVHVKGNIVDAAGTEYAAAQGRFVSMTGPESVDVDDGLVYLGDEARIFDYLREDAGQEP